MGYVKIPEMLSPELIKALAGNVYTIKDEPGPKDEMAAAWKEYMKEDKKHDKRDDKWDDKCDDKKHDKRDDKWDDKWDDKKHDKKKDKEDEECCCPKKVKFIFVLNNAVVINVNAACEEEEQQPA